MNESAASDRFLLCLIDAGGTVPPALGLARALLTRGHRVRVLADPTIEADARAAGCAFSPWREAPHFNSRAEQTALLGAAEGGNPFRALKAVRRYAGKATTRRFAADVVSTVEQFPVDAILSDGVPGILIGAQATGLPTATLMAQIYVRPTAGLPLVGTGWSPARGVLGRARDTVIPHLASWLLARTLPRLNLVTADYGQPPLREVFELFDRCRRVLVMTSASFDFPAPWLPDNVRYVGPQLDDPEWAVGDRWQRRGTNPLVLVAASSVYQDQTDMLRRVAQALGRLPVRGLLTTGPAVQLAAVSAPSNVEVLRAVPHRRVLPEASVVVTHAGHGTVLKTLAAGVPMVCMPMGRDQKDNTIRVLRLGAGVRISKRATPHQIAAAISEVLDHPHYTDAARRFADVLAWEAANLPSAADEAVALLSSCTPKQINKDKGGH